MPYVSIETGTLEWNLAQQVVHRAGSVLPINFQITNSTEEARSYQIFMAMFDPATGAVIEGTTGPISINGVSTFEVEGQSQLTLVAPLRIDYSNALLQAALYDVEANEMSVGLQTYLEQPPGVGEQIAPIASFAGGVMALGMVAMIVGEVVPT